MRDLIIELLDLLSFDKMLDTEIESYMLQYESQLKAHLNDTHAPEREKALEILRNEIGAKRTTLKEAVIKIYETSLDEETVRATRDFFASDACRKHNDVSPAVVQTIQSWFNDRLTETGPALETALRDAAASPDAEVGVVPLPTPSA